MIFCVSMDLDPLWCYRQIYHLGESTASDPLVSLASERFCQLLNSSGVRGTLFVVGNSLSDPRASEAILSAHQQGHEIANHTYSHPYSLFKLPQVEIIQEIAKGAEAIETCCGKSPSGFRAPGYMLGANVLPALHKTQALYDSSVLPSPLYQGVKAVALGWLKLRGKPSFARMGDVRESFASNQPYRPDVLKPWRQGTSPLIELPITSVWGIPLIGQVLALGRSTVSHSLAAQAERLEFVQLQLHGADLLDLKSDNLDPGLGVQRDFRIPWQQKADAFCRFIERLLRTHRTMTLKEAASYHSQLPTQ